MIRLVLVALVLALPVKAFAADKALILSDDEQAAFRQILDAATKGSGIQIAPAAVYLLNKLNTAPVVTPHVDAPKPEEPKQ